MVFKRNKEQPQCFKGSSALLFLPSMYRTARSRKERKVVFVNCRKIKVRGTVRKG